MLVGGIEAGRRQWWAQKVEIKEGIKWQIPVILTRMRLESILDHTYCTLNFLLSAPTPPAPGTLSQGDRVASIRMSLEHLKALTFVLHRHLIGYEQQAHISIPLPMEVLRGMQIREEDWQTSAWFMRLDGAEGQNQTVDTSLFRA